MGRRKGRKSGGQKVEVLDSDDDRNNPDPNSEEYYNDDIDDFHANREKILLDKGADLEPADSSEDDEEVLGFDDDDDDFEDDEEIQEYEKRLQHFQRLGFKDEMGSDIEEDKEELPDAKEWGKKRNKYYGADVSDDDFADFSGSEPDAAQLEEDESKAIQAKIADTIAGDDFDLDIFVNKKSVEEKEAVDEKVVGDVNKLSKKEKLKLLEKQSPEFLPLVEDYKDKMTELKDKFLPVLNLIRNETIPESKATQYIETKVKLYMNYCVNINFYMMLKAKHSPAHNHPVIPRIMQYRNLIKELEKADKKIEAELEELVTKIKKGEDIVFEKPAISSPKRLQKTKRSKQAKKDKTANKKKLSELMNDSDDSEMEEETPEGGISWGRKRKAEKEEGKYETKDEKEALEYYDMMKSGKKRKEDHDDDEEDNRLGDDIDEDLQSGEDYNEDEEEEEIGKRAISRDIAKNKGLTPKRKKENKNPRVKHKLKYRKAKIRRKGQIREVRTEMNRYSGEISGIRAGIKRSVKLK